jgi:hypothetical protein
MRTPPVSTAAAGGWPAAVRARCRSALTLGDADVACDDVPGCVRTVAKRTTRPVAATPISGARGHLAPERDRVRHCGLPLCVAANPVMDDSTALRAAAHVCPLVTTCRSMYAAAAGASGAPTAVTGRRTSRCTPQDPQRSRAAPRTVVPPYAQVQPARAGREQPTRRPAHAARESPDDEPAGHPRPRWHRRCAISASRTSQLCNVVIGIQPAVAALVGRRVRASGTPEIHAARVVAPRLPRLDLKVLEHRDGPREEHAISRELPDAKPHHGLRERWHRIDHTRTGSRGGGAGGASRSGAGASRSGPSAGVSGTAGKVSGSIRIGLDLPGKCARLPHTLTNTKLGY